MDPTNLRTMLQKIYGNDEVILKQQSERYQSLDNQFDRHFGQKGRYYFSTPGRTELGGNHTDHNHGRVLAASINLDSIAVAAKIPKAIVTIHSEGYVKPFRIDLDQLQAVDQEAGTTSALIRGIASRINELGYNIGGLNACITSDVLPGSGLSSSASIEVLLASIFNALYNDNKIPAEQMAQIGQYAENEYFGKPCGLMDQMACAVGGIIAIDFKYPENPEVKKVNFDFDREKYSLLVVDTGGTHADLTDDYAAVPDEMKSVAEFFDVRVLREVDSELFLDNIGLLREQLGDRAVLRAIHFMKENTRVTDEVNALESGDFIRFLNLVKESGDSSFKWLQNIYTTKNIREQGVSLALALTEKYIADIGVGACRIHGGGFAGTIQVFLPDDKVPPYIENMEKVFGANSIMVLKIRPVGSVMTLP